jgi:hypothetical protein
MNDMIVLNKQANNRTSSGWLDISCFPNLRETFRFGEKSVPMLVVYRKRDRSFVRMENRLNAYDGQMFVEASLGRQMDRQYRPVELRLGYDQCKGQPEGEEEL